MSVCVTLTRYFYPIGERSDRDLATQLSQAESVIEALVSYPLAPHQTEALICLVSDLIAGLAESPSVSFEQSFLVKALNKGMLQIAASEFSIFCCVQGKLETRAWDKRRAEAFLFSQGTLWFP